MRKHLPRIGIVKMGGAPVRIAAQAEDVERKTAPACERQDIDCIANVARPGFAWRIALDVEDAACDREIPRLRGLRAPPPLAIVSLAIQPHCLSDHVWRNVITDVGPAMTMRAQKTQKIAEPA